MGGMLARNPLPLGRGALRRRRPPEHPAAQNRSGHPARRRRGDARGHLDLGDEAELEDERDLRAEPGRVDRRPARGRSVAVEREPGAEDVVAAQLDAQRPAGGLRDAGLDAVHGSRALDTLNIAAGSLVEVAHRLLPGPQPRPLPYLGAVLPGAHLERPAALDLPGP